MGLTAGQIPRVANVLNSGIAKISGSLPISGALGTDTNGVTCYTAGASGGRVISMMGTTDDSAISPNVFVYINRSSTIIPIGLVNIPVSSGNTNAARFPVDFLNGTNLPGLPIDNTGRQYVPLLANDILKVSLLANSTAGRSIYVSAHGVDFQP
jgi:hypothetical protein